MELPTEFQTKNETERPMHFLTRVINPMTEMWQLMRGHSKQIKELTKEVEEAKQKTDELLLDIVQEAFNLRSFINEVEEKMKQVGIEEECRGLDILIKRVEDILENEQITIEEPTWKILDDQMRAKVSVQSYIRRDDINFERVIETRFPIVYRNGKLWKQGIVIAETPRKS